LFKGHKHENIQSHFLARWQTHGDGIKTVRYKFHTHLQYPRFAISSRVAPSIVTGTQRVCMNIGEEIKQGTHRITLFTRVSLFCVIAYVLFSFYRGLVHEADSTQVFISVAILTMVLVGCRLVDRMSTRIEE